MNILFVRKSPFKGAGGVGRVTEILSEEFIKKGHDPNYFSFCEGKLEEHAGITQYFCENGEQVLANVNIDKLTGLIDTLNVDIIVNQTGLSDPDVLEAINLALDRSDQKVTAKVFSVHHNCVKCLYEHFELVVKENYRKSRFYPIVKNPVVLKFLKYRHKKKYASTIRYLINHSDRFVLLSESFIPDLSIYLGNVPSEGVSAILNPAPFEAVNTEAEKENRLIYVGRINFQQKRSDLLIPIWKKAMIQHPGWELDVLGDGEALPELKQMADEAGLERIHFHGFKDPKPFLRKAKYMLLTSAFEGFGMVLVEGQAYGVIPVAFNCFSAISDIIDNNKNGVLVEPLDLKDFSEQLNRLINNEKQRPALSENARQSIDKFKPGKIANEWLELFES